MGSDLGVFWTRDHLNWSMEGMRNFVMAYGTLCILAGAKLIPYLLHNLSPRGFTSLTNSTNMAGFFLRGSLERTWVFLLAVPLLMPGVNGASGTALKAIAADRATSEGFGKGEFSAWTNNLRAMACAIATVLYGNYYAWSKTQGVPAGSTYALAGVLGAVLPEIILRLTRDSEMMLEKESGNKPEVVDEKAEKDTTVEASDEDSFEHVGSETKELAEGCGDERPSSS